ncbi:MAG TPA: rod-binding protein [Terriglobales bacterium]|nr:rod-binding protein [Terriglobales bacterium]
MEARAAAPAGTQGAIAPADVRRLRATAHEIESMFLQQMLKTMRQATPGLQGPLSGTGQRVYQEMMDEQLARSMAKGGGIGLADMLVRDVLRRQGVEKKPSSPPADVPIGEPGGLR